MELFDIRDIPMAFPFKPYPCQLAYMDKVVETLDQGHNALLESPTGTGKTLCLLVATLAWIQKRRPGTGSASGSGSGPGNGPKMTIKYENPSDMKLVKPMKPPVKVMGTTGPGSGASVSVIIYASRTHSQLSQVISELRASGYTPKMTVMGSREQLCIHDKISKLKGAKLNHACNASGAQRRCTFKNNLDTYTSSAGILDIEQLAELGREDQVCPYFLSRQNVTSSELVLLPYNYLIDASIRATLKIEWKDAIVILDEAHNLEKIASDASSFTLSSGDISACITEMQNVLKLLKLQVTSDAGSSGGADKKGAGDVARKPNMQRCVTILKALFALESHIDRIPVSPSSDGVKLTGGAKCAVLPGKWLFDVLEKVGFNLLSASHLITEIRVCADFIMDDANSMMAGSSFGSGGGGSVGIPDPKLISLAASLGKIFKSTAKNTGNSIRKTNVEDYRVFLKEDAPQRGASVKKNPRILNYWCFSPGAAMEDLKALGVRSLILTSGTLSPMEAFKEDMKVPFAVELENPHVIDDNQIWISALAAGPEGGQLLSTYERRETNSYKDELGKSILSICQNMLGGHMNNGTVHPRLDGGVLVFFPSYGMMESACVWWKESGLWDQLCRVMGKVVTETTTKKSSWTDNAKGSKNYQSYNRNEKWTSGANQRQNDWSTSSSKQVRNEDTKNADIVAGVVQEFEGALATHGRCLLLAVCRGKVSEGIDFKDDKGRVVIMTGIPFSPFMDPWVVLKKKYLDDNCKNKGLHFSSNPTTTGGQQVAVKAEQYKPPAQYQPSSYKPSSLILSGTMQNIKPGGGQTALQSAGGSPAKRLSGQAWYVQSASRAVNQALGRVFRHRRDWGAVFLLDSRFQRGDQQQQLSSWIRPHLSKHSNFPNALVSFRGFCTAALGNSDLVVKVEATVTAIKPFRKPMVMSTTAKDENAFQKSMIVQSSALIKSNTGEEDINYINPSMAMSQNSFEATTAPRTAFSIMPVSHSTRSIQSSSVPEKTSDLNSMSKMFSIIKNTQKNSIPARDSVKGSSSSSSRVLAPFKSPLDMLEGNVLARKLSQSQHSTATRGCSSSNVLSANDDFTSSTPFRGENGLSTTDAFTSRSQGTTNLSQSKKSGEAFFNLSTAQAITDKKRKSEGKVKFKALIGKLEKNLKPERFERFINEIKGISNLSKASGGQIESVTEVRKFVDKILRLLHVVLPGPLLRETVEVLSSLFQEKHVGVYNSTAKNIMKELSCQSPSPPTRSTPLQSHSQKLQSQGTQQGVLTDLRSSKGKTYSLTSKASSGETSSSHQSILSQSSNDSIGSKKRGFQMMNSLKRQASAGTTAAPASVSTTSSIPPPKNFFNTLKNINIEKQKPRSSGSEVSFTQQEKIKKTKLDCIICSQPPRSPLINECGHVCCETCWESWLKVQRTCPLCRAETHKSNLSRLILK